MLCQTKKRCENQFGPIQRRSCHMRLLRLKHPPPPTPNSSRILDLYTLWAHHSMYSQIWNQQVAVWWFSKQLIIYNNKVLNVKINRKLNGLVFCKKVSLFNHFFKIRLDYYILKQEQQQKKTLYNYLFIYWRINYAYAYCRCLYLHLKKAKQKLKWNEMNNNITLNVKKK